MFDSISIGIDLVDKKGKIVECNEALSRITGSGMDEMRGKRFAELATTAYSTDEELVDLGPEARIAERVHHHGRQEHSGPSDRLHHPRLLGKDAVRGEVRLGHHLTDCAAAP